MKARYVYSERPEPLTLILSPEAGARKKSSGALGRNSTRNIEHNVGFFRDSNRLITAAFLALSQRERIKVRDCSRVALQAPSKLPRALRQNFPGQNDCKISVRGCPGAQENDRAIDRAPVLRSKCDRRRQARRRGAIPDNKNRGCNRQWDVAGGIYTRQSGDYGDVAKGCVRRELDFFADSERESLKRGLGGDTKPVESGSYLQPRFLPPHLNPLPRFGREGDVACAARLILNYGASSRRRL